MRKVFIGIGHGGNDPGAVGNGLREADVNLTMGLTLRKELERHGIVVGISRTKDENDPLVEEIAEAKAFKPDIAIDVHNNAGGGKGFEVYRQTGTGKANTSAKLAGCIEKRVLEIGQNSRGVKTNVQANGTDYFGWLRQLDCPAVLCEGAFVDNKEDVKMIDTIEKREAFGVAYAKGILDYFGIEYKSENVTLTPITGDAELTAKQMRTFLFSKNPTAPDYTEIFLDEGRKEGIRGDIAFAQSCLETGYWKFGGDVKLEQNNFCGLGATGGGEPGCSFATAREGIRAQIQHLFAYACDATLSLHHPCIDPRFAYVPRGCAPYVEWLGIPDNPKGKGWAAGQNYGKKILEVWAGIAAVQAEAETATEADASELERLRKENEELRQALSGYSLRNAELAEKLRQINELSA